MRGLPRPNPARRLRSASPAHRGVLGFEKRSVHCGQSRAIAFAGELTPPGIGSGTPRNRNSARPLACASLSARFEVEQFGEREPKRRDQPAVQGTVCAGSPDPVRRRGCPPQRRRHRCPRGTGPSARRRAGRTTRALPRHVRRHRARGLGDDVVHQLHDLDDPDGVALRDALADLNERWRTRRRRTPQDTDAGCRDHYVRAPRARCADVADPARYGLRGRPSATR